MVAAYFRNAEFDNSPVYVYNCEEFKIIFETNVMNSTLGIRTSVIPVK